MRASIVVLLALASACGYSWQADLRRHVALQRGCPEDRVVIVADDGNRLSRQVRLESCGDSLMYQHVNTGATFEWRDITGSAADAAPYVAPSP